MIFVVGIPRSGTTWVSELLAQHPRCERLTPKALGWTSLRPTLETGLFLRGLGDSVIRNMVPENEKRWVEKTPAHLLHVKRIRRVFPEAQIVEVLRSPGDVVQSMVSAVHWRGRPKSIEDARRLYVRYLSAPLLADVYVRYETLWREPVAETRTLYEQLGLDTAPAAEIAERTRYGRSLPDALKIVFQGGVPS